jgi:hypothetical protein
MANALLVKCPKCGAAPKQPCVKPDGRKLSAYGATSHKPREKAAVDRETEAMRRDSARLKTRKQVEATVGTLAQLRALVANARPPRLYPSVFVGAEHKDAA